MDLKFYKKLIWIGERSIRNHPKDKDLIGFVKAQNDRIKSEIKAYLKKNPKGDVAFDPAKEVYGYKNLLAKDLK